MRGPVRVQETDIGAIPLKLCLQGAQHMPNAQTERCFGSSLSLAQQNRFVKGFPRLPPICNATGRRV